jgi:hypothetical protein
MVRSRLPWLALAVCLLPGCSSQSKAPAIGHAYVGPATLKLRRELGPTSPEAVTVKHGERVEIIQRRRRFLKVRAPNGVEGWTEMRQLMASDQMSELDELSEIASQLPSQGAATVYEPLNIHTDPNRYSPSFYQIKEGEIVDVVEQRLTPRVAYEQKDILPKPVPKPRVRKTKEEKDSPRIPKLPAPAAPKPPANWLDLSKSPQLEPEKPLEPPEPPKPTPTDDWTLVRVKNGRAGWVVTRMLKMNIPDEVAQYSEGHRITSYFKMKELDDGGQKRYHWLWTTLGTTNVPYEFDSFRYFIWNLRHHRYETAYVQRNLKGYYPIEVHPVQVTVGKKAETFPGFTLILEEADGQRYRCTYAYEYYLVKLVSKTPWQPSEEGGDSVGLASSEPGAPSAPPAAPVSFYGRMKRNVAQLKQKWFGR